MDLEIDEGLEGTHRYLLPKNISLFGLVPPEEKKNAATPQQIHSHPF